jgi:tetratricopeptide (TPR) repeat protein
MTRSRSTETRLADSTLRASKWSTGVEMPRMRLAWVAAGIALSVSSPGCERSSPPESARNAKSASDADRPRWTVLPLSPLPISTDATRRRIQALATAGDLPALPAAHAALLAELAKIWGASDTRCAPYHYDYCLSLRSANRLDEGLAEVARGLERWPSSLAHRLFDAVTRMKKDNAEEKLTPGTRAAVERLLHDSLAPGLKQLGVELADVWVQWSNLLVLTRAPEEALEALKKISELRKPDVYRALLEGRALLDLGRAIDAVRVLEPFRGSAEIPEFELTLASAYLDAERPADAWSIFEPLIARLAARAADTDSQDESAATRIWKRVPIEDLARPRAARALIDLGRPATARDIVLPTLSRRPTNSSALHVLSTALHALGKSETSASIRRRERETARHSYHAQHAAKDLQLGAPASMWYHTARALEEIDRPGDALDALEKALELAPLSTILHTLRVERLLLIGRVDLALAANTTAFERTRSPLCRALQARLFARTGSLEAARAILASLDRESWTDRSLDFQVRSSVAHARLEIGEIDRVRAWVESIDESKEALSSESLETVQLCRATLLLADGKLSEAEAIATQHALSTAEEKAWAGTIAALAAAGVRGSPIADPSDLFDTAWLVHWIRTYPGLVGNLRPKEAIALLDRYFPRVAAILERMARRLDSDARADWHELIDLWVECGAERKARESAWYLLFRTPDDPDSWAAVASRLSRPEDIVEVHALIADAERRGIGSPGLVRAIETRKERLGIAP